LQEITDHLRSSPEREDGKENRMNRSIDCQVGIFNGQYRLETIHRDGSLTVSAPYVKWVDNSGSYATRRIMVPAGRRAKAVKECFANDQMYTEDQDFLPDLLREAY
jgi:hypothetical protein